MLDSTYYLCNWDIGIRMIPVGNTFYIYGYGRGWAPELGLRLHRTIINTTSYPRK